MTDFTVPLNRIGVVRADLIDITGAKTNVQPPHIYWYITGGGSSYFSLVVAADGLSAEIHPIAVGSASLQIEALDGYDVLQTRTVEIVANASDSLASGADPKFIGTNLSIVHNVGALA